MASLGKPHMNREEVCPAKLVKYERSWTFSFIITSMYYVYLLKLSNDDFYAGSTMNLKLRLEKHQSGAVRHTSKFRPVVLVWYAAFESKNKALEFEKYLKSSSGKAFRNKHLL